MKINNVVIIDKEPASLSKLEELLKTHARSVTSASNSKEAILLLKQQSTDLVIGDSTSLDDVTKSALKKKGIEFLILADKTPASILRALQNRACPLKNRNFIGKSPAIKKVLKTIERVAKSQANVFISGESGTGKEEIAALIHLYSKRKDNPFIKVNCAALPETLIESEFFGHEKGAFTGALGRRAGRFELADQGTLLLDEISEVPLALQSKLLRAVQEQEFERLGGTKTVHVNVRLIATSNQDMKKAIQNKSFREDLYYRLNVVPIHLPSLRERTEDIIPLSEHFLKVACEKNNTPLKALSEDAKSALLNYPWPGNIRELSNVIEHSVVVNEELIITSEHLRIEMPDKCTVIIPQETKHLPLETCITLKEMEKRHILNTLKTFNQNRTKAALALGISVRTLRNKLAIYQTETNPTS